jgi:hypothetical protein
MSWMTLHNSSRFSFWNVVKVISKAFVINHFWNPESLIFGALTNILERHPLQHCNAHIQPCHHPQGDCLYNHPCFYILVTQSPLLCKNITFPNSTPYNKSNFNYLDGWWNDLHINNCFYCMQHQDFCHTIEVGTSLLLHIIQWSWEHGQSYTLSN